MVTDTAATILAADLVTMETATTQEETITLVVDLMAASVVTVHLVPVECTTTALTTVLWVVVDCTMVALTTILVASMVVQVAALLPPPKPGLVQLLQNELKTDITNNDYHFCIPPVLVSLSLYSAYLF